MGAFHSCLDAGQRAERKKAALQVSLGVRPELAHEQIHDPCQAGTMALDRRWQCMGLHRVTKHLETCTPRVKLLKYSALGVRRRRSLRPPLYPLCVMFR